MRRSIFVKKAVYQYNPVALWDRLLLLFVLTMPRTDYRHTFSMLLIMVLTLQLVVTGCASHVHQLAPEKESDSSSVIKPSLNSTVQTVDSSPVMTQPQGRTDQERLALLWHKRAQEQSAVDYPVGPGDLLEVNVATVEELKTRTVRVSGEGTIALPFVGVIQASGLTEEELRKTIYQRLEKYIYNPQMDLFVREYHSRQVAVVGSVEKPGLYNLASGANTILDMLSLAGGMKAEAAARIQFIPAEPVEKHRAKELVSTLPSQLSGSDTPLILKSAEPISIDLRSLTKGGNQMYLSLPVRPGDVIMIPGSGEVLVDGWVAKPASYKITPGLTVLGAVAAAGGPHFAADTSTVTLIRTGKDGEKTSVLADLEKIKRRESPDIPVQEGDIIEVSSSTSKLVPYGIYFFFSNVFRVGTVL